MATKAEYRVSDRGQSGGKLVIDKNGRYVPAGQVGDTYYVDYRNGLDTNNGESINKALKTLSAAYGKCTSNNNDVIFVDGDSTVVETEMITWAKNRITVIGVGGYGHYGAAAKVSIGVTTAATDIALMQMAGVRNTFIGIKFISENTVAEGLYTIAEGGEYTTYVDCEFYKSEDLDDAGASEFLHNGDSTKFYNCTFGSSANQTGNIRANVLLTATLSGKKCRDTYFENCIFLGKADDTDKVFVYGANATDVERMLLMKNCTFLNNALGAGTPAHAVGFGAAQTQGTVLLQDCASVDCTVMAEASRNIYVTGAVPTFATTGVSVAA
jgi:hypothetical protein